MTTLGSVRRTRNTRAVLQNPQIPLLEAIAGVTRTRRWAPIRVVNLIGALLVRRGAFADLSRDIVLLATTDIARKKENDTVAQFESLRKQVSEMGGERREKQI